MPTQPLVVTPFRRPLTLAACLSACIASGLLTTGCRKGGARADAAAPGSAAATSSAAAPARPGPAPAKTDASGLPIPKSLDKFDAFSALGYQPEWIGYPVMPRGHKIEFIDPFDDFVLVHSTGNMLTAMDTATGANRWSQSMGSSLTKFVGNVRRDNGDILCSSQGEVFVLEAGTGVIKDRQRLAVLANTRPASVDNVVIFGCPTGEVLGHSLGSGYKLWGYMLDGTITTPPVKVGGSVAVVSQRGELVILNPREGTANVRGRLYGGLANVPVAGGETIFLASLDQSIWAYDEYGREARWRVRLEQPLRAQPAYHNGRLIVEIPDEGLACLDAASGKRLWTLAGARGTVVASRAGKLILWDGAAVATIDPENGDMVDRIALPGVDRLVSDQPADGSLYAVSNKGEVQKYSPKR